MMKRLVPALVALALTLGLPVVSGGAPMHSLSASPTLQAATTPTVVPTPQPKVKKLKKAKKGKVKVKKTKRAKKKKGLSATPPLVIGGPRPAKVFLPSDYTLQEQYPLVVLLHGRGANALIQDFYIGTSSLVDAAQYVLVTPDGMLDDGGRRFWNATPACCAPAGFEDVDDVGYLRSLIQEARMTYSIDADRVYLFGHSNGGFMSFRMACEASDQVTAIASLAGSTWFDPDDCQPAKRPVSVLAIHGTDDATVPYAGRLIPGNPSASYPGAVETVERKAGAAQCELSEVTTLPNLDLAADLPGAESTVLRYEEGCKKDTDYELWTIVDGPHVPILAPGFAAEVLDWLFQRSR